MGSPARVGFDAHHPQIRVAVEDTPEDHRADDVLTAADDPHETVELRTAELRVGRLIVPTREDVEADGKPQVDRGAPERVPTRVVVVALVVTARVPGHHDAPQPEPLDLDEVLDAFGHAAQRGLADAEQTIGGRRLELGHPEVVGVEARLLVVGVGMVAQQHADARVQDLGRHTIAILLTETCQRIPPPGVQLVPTDEIARVDLLPWPSRGGDHAVRHATAAVVDGHHRTHHVVGHRDGRAITEPRVDAIEIAVAGLGYVRVGRDCEQRHDSFPSRCRPKGRPAHPLIFCPLAPRRAAPRPPMFR